MWLGFNHSQASDCSVLLQRLHRDPSVLEEVLDRIREVFTVFTLRTREVILLIVRSTLEMCLSWWRVVSGDQWSREHPSGLFTLSSLSSSSDPPL